MQGGSAKSLSKVLERTNALVTDGADAGALGDDLFAMSLTLDQRHALRRALTEPVVPVAAKARLLRSLVEGKLGGAAIEVVEEAAGARWSGPRDLADALEEASVAAHVARADSDGRLDDLEDSLFRFARIVEGSTELREALTDRAVPVEGRRALVQELVGDKVDPSTGALLQQAVAGRHRPLSAVLAKYQRIAASRRDSMIATVWVASPLSQEHRERLIRALSAQHDKQIHLNVIIDPEVLGGVRVAVGEEVLDSTVEARLRQAQRRLER
jgi:F-type H+-transporting ATPase subunit delta